MNAIKNLVFDFGGVIVNLNRNRCIGAFAEIGVDVHEQLTNNYLHKDMFMGLELGQMTAAEFRDAIRLLTPNKLTNRQIDDAWILMLDGAPDYKLEALLELRRTYNVFLLSNTNEIHWHWSEQHIFSYEGHSLPDFFHRIYLSYELHLLKPHAGIFEHVVADAGIRPEESLFIDDALPNCRTAGELGFRTYTPAAREDWRHLFI